MRSSQQGRKEVSEEVKKIRPSRHSFLRKRIIG